jgi:hypothetical protein
MITFVLWFVYFIITEINYLLGTTGIIMAAPSHYDTRMPIDVLYSRIQKKMNMKMEEL